MLDRLAANWVYGGSLAGLLILLLTPLLLRGWPASSTAVFLCLPIYMLHQWEEHDDDRFRLFLNRFMGHGHEVLSHRDVFWINVPGVWGVIAVSFWLAAVANPGFGLIAAYLMLVNGIIHAAQSVVAREYNPGLITAVALFFPFGGYCVWVIQQTGHGTVAMHALGFGLALLIHAAVLLRVRSNLRASRKNTAAFNADSRL